MKRLLLLLPVAAVTILALWVNHKRNEPPETPFARVRREPLVATLPTNGKVEPIEWQAVRSEIAGIVDKVPVQEGQQVAEGATLAAISQSGMQAEVQAAAARVAQAQAELATVEAGGKRSEIADIENSLAKARHDRETAQREYDSLRRLAEKQAATPVDVAAARSRVRDAELQIQGLEARRASLVGTADRTVAAAKLRDAEAALALARARVAQTVIRAPIVGTVYDLAVRPGSYVNTGDIVANVGRLDRVRVRVYVDEPELGRVAIGQPVTITWDARPGQTWSGVVEKMPASIVTVGTRQVGEVLCTIANPRRELVPGTNVNVEIRTAHAGNALLIPKEALRRDAGGTGVFTLEGDRLVWRSVKTGLSSVTRIQIIEGLQEGDPVALPTERVLHAGERVAPVYQQ